MINLNPSKSTIDFFVIFSGRLFNGLLLIAATRIYSTLLSDAEIGKLGVVLSSLFFFTSCIFFPIGSFINQNILFWLKNNKWQTHLASYFAYIAGLIFLISAIFNYIIDPFLALIAAIYLIGLCFNQTLIPILNAMLFRKVFVSLTFLTTLFYIFLSFQFVTIYSAKAEFWLLGQSIANIFFAILTVPIILFLQKQSFNFVPRIVNIYQIKNVLNFALPLVITSLAGWSILNLYKIIGGFFIGYEAIAVLILCSVLSTGIFGAIESATIQLYHADFLQELVKSNNINDRKNAFISFFQKVMFTLTSFLVIIILFSPLIIKIGLDQRFHGYVWLFIMFLIVDYFRNLNHVLSQFAFAEFKTKVLIKGNIVGAIFSIIFISFSVMSDNWMAYIPASLIIAYMLNILFQYKQLKINYGSISLLPGSKTAMILFFLFLLLYVEYYIFFKA
jgi:O-antigen/teichoic acid export membrane protein